MKSLLAVKILGVITLAYTSALALGSLVKPVRIDTTITHLDKLMHFSAYCGLAALWLSLLHLLRTRTTQKKWAPVRFYVIIGAALVVYGIIIELLQGGLTTYRTPDVWDAIANTVGVLVGSFAFILFFKKFKGLKS